MTNAEKTRIQKGIVESLPERPHGRLLLAPRIGKSKIAIDIIKRFKPASILWATPSADLAENTIPTEFDTWKATKYKKTLTTTTWTSLDNYKGHYGLIILDEEQFATENNLKHLLSGELTADCILSMTGTATKHEVKLDLYKQLKLPILHEMSINDAVDAKLLANYTIKVVEVNMSNKRNIPAGSKDKPFMTTEALQYEYLHKVANQAIFQKRKDMMFRILARMRAVYNSPAKHEVAEFLMKNLTGRKLFFCSSIEQADILSPYPHHSKTNNDNLEKFKTGEIDTITMVNTGGVGETYKSVDHLVMIQPDSDKNGLTSQKICRTLLQQKDYKATIWIITLIGTQDEKWLASALESFDKSKVEYIRFINLSNQNLIENKLENEISNFMKPFGVEEVQMGSTKLKL